MSEFPAGTVTFLLTDVEGSTERWELDAEAMALAMARHEDILAGAIAAHGGERPSDQGEGDSMLAAFARASDALAAALEAQQGLLETELRVRMALHTGEPLLRAQRYAGPAIIRTARVRALAPGGQILVSQTTRDLLVDSLPGDVTLVAAGEHKLKGMNRPELVYAVCHPDLPELPEPLRSGVGTVRDESASHNLPLALTSLIGRARELDAVGDALRRSRLVTLTGPGGAGKTTLAVELARRQVGHRPDGVWLVDLTAAADLDPAAELARTLEVGSQGAATPTESLRRYLADRDALIVLDNCEHVIDACAQLTTAVLSACPEIHILATSRESLRVIGETVWRLDPLDVQDAQRLFVERARQRRPDFFPTEQMEATIAALCARLDHLPLAIELAAARINMMSPAEILEGLDARLDTLGGGSRSSPARHRTVRAAVEWSHDLLDADEQRAFRSLAVFVGGFDARAATAVALGLTVEGFARLVDKSIVAVGESQRGRTRYRLLETIRELAYERLSETGELDAARERHLRYFSVSDEDVVWDGWPSSRAVEVLGELEDDYGNVVAALEWAAASDPCAARALLSGMGDLFFMLGHADGRRLAETLLDRCELRDRHRAQMLNLVGLLSIAGDTARARRALEEASLLSAELGERTLEGWARAYQGISENMGTLVEPAREHLETARALLGDLEDARGWAMATAALGLTYVQTDELSRARELVEEALAANIAAGYDWGQGQCQIYLGIITERTDADSALATLHYRKAVEHLRPFRGGTLLQFALVFQAGVLGRREPARALRVLAAIHAERERTGSGLAPFVRIRAEAVRTAAETALGDSAPQIWAEGARLGFDDAIALAFGEADAAAPLPAGLSE